LVIDEDGDQGTTSDQTVISSFQCEHCSWPTPMAGAFADLVILPLPGAANPGEIGMNPINMTAWNSIDTSGKILAIGKEVLMADTWRTTYVNKLSQQPPAAVIYLYWYGWRSSFPRSFGSSAGKPLGYIPNYYWDLQIPVGSVSYADSLLIWNRETAVDVSSNVTVRSVISNGDNYNVVGKIAGYRDPEKLVIISGHYDSVMCGGFCDNGAGTAGVIELARVFAEAVQEGMYRPRYTLLFVAFAGEELGLVGSTNYVRQHKSQMANIVAVLNLDCIGSDYLCVSETEAANGLDLDETILAAAQDLGIPAILESPGGSDEDTFRDPAGTADYYYWWWESDSGISDALPVNSSAGIFSVPIVYDPTGASGWIHTENDNSTSTQTLGWVEADDLQDQLKVTALSVMRVSPPVYLHNVAITETALSKTIVGEGYDVRINVSTLNNGIFTETFNLTAYVNETEIGTVEVTLESDSSTTVYFVWNTSGFARGNYTIEAHAWPVTGENGTEDNTFTFPPVKVAIPGDVNGDDIVELSDFFITSQAFGSTLHSSHWNPNADINGDGYVELMDFWIMSQHFGEGA
jgi:hypothetical protein